MADFRELEEILASFSAEGVNPGAPLVVVGFCPPYYPGVTNPEQGYLHKMVRSFTRRQWGQEYENQAYFTGISDLSYAMAAGDAGIMDHMLGGRPTYQIPFEEIKAISMDCINIGPWGKDFHRPAERVFKQDLVQRIPLLIDHVIRSFGENNHSSGKDT